MLGPSESWIHRQQNRALAWFDEWFASPACVWQTLFACVGICIVELLWPDLDPHYFYLLAILTVYSAITQPALAQSNAVTAEQLERLLSRQSDIIALMQQELEETNEILDDVRDLHLFDQKDEDTE